MLFGWKDNKFMVCGLPFLRLKAKEDVLSYKFLGCVFYKTNKSLLSIQYQVDQNKNFDTSAFDKKLEQYAPITKDKKQKTNPHRIAYLITELYDTGGHSKCILENAKALRGLYEQTCFISQIDRSQRYGAKILNQLAKQTHIVGKNINPYHYKKAIINLFNDIVNFNPKVLFAWIHPSDCLITILLEMLKKHTNIKILYSPHASHFPNLGISYADAVLEALPTSAYITQNYRHCDKTVFIPMMSKEVKGFPSFSNEAITAKRKEIGITDNDLCTMSGATAYKFFDGSSSEYFQTIKEFLERNRNVKHVILSDFNEKQRKIIDEIFAESEAKSRLIVLPSSDEYELFFKCADVFIDSFPVSSALTMIDLMRLQIPYVVKINRENAHFSFHEYQLPNYPYMFENIVDLLKGVETLLANKAERDRIIEMNYQHYMNTFEGNVAKARLREIIDNAEHIERFYTGQINGKYQFKELEL